MSVEGSPAPTGAFLTAAYMFRLNQADPSSDRNITISREVFDALVRAVELANRANADPAPVSEYHITRLETGFRVSARNDLLGEVAVEAASMIEGLADVKWQMKLKVDQIVR